MRRFTTKTLDIGMVNTDYSVSIADCIEFNSTYYPDLDSGDVVFTVAENSALPRGLTLSEDGVISGKPKLDARIAVTIDATCDDEVLSQTFVITIVGEGGAIIFNSQDDALTANIGIAYSGSVAKAEIYDPYATPEEIAKFPDITYSLANGSLLPEGLVLEHNGTITGTPTKECIDYSFTVVASALGYREADLKFTLSVLYPIGYTAKDLATAAYGKSYVASVADAVCLKPVTYALKDGDSLPNGLALTEGGYIVGTPLDNKSELSISSNEIRAVPSL